MASMTVEVYIYNTTHSSKRACRSAALSSKLPTVVSRSRADHGHKPVRTAQRKKSHVMRPSTARAITTSLQVIFP